jgi:hypothetical protein
MKKQLLFMALAMVFCGCGTVQSIVKSSLPYTSTLNIPASAETSAEQFTISTATSLDQSFSRKGNNARKVNGVHIISAKLQAINPGGFNIGNFSSVKIYLSKPDGNVELPVASQLNIAENTGNAIVLEIDNSHLLDELVREENIKVRLIYKLRNKIDAPADLRLTMSLTAYPDKKD